MTQSSITEVDNDPFLVALGWLETVVMAAFVVFFLALFSCAVLPLTIGHLFGPISGQTAYRLAIGTSFAWCALGLVSAVFQFRERTVAKFWEGVLVLTVSLLVPPVTYYLMWPAILPA